jgi:hypothetical protein
MEILSDILFFVSYQIQNLTDMHTKIAELCVVIPFLFDKKYELILGLADEI